MRTKSARTFPPFGPSSRPNPDAAGFLPPSACPVAMSPVGRASAMRVQGWGMRPVAMAHGVPWRDAVATAARLPSMERGLEPTTTRHRPLLRFEGPALHSL